MSDFRYENLAPVDYDELTPSKQQKITAEIAEKAYRRGFQQGAYFTAVTIQHQNATVAEAIDWATGKVASWRFYKPTTREVRPPPLKGIVP